MSPDPPQTDSPPLALCAYPSAREFIDAVSEFDDPFMNWALGIAIERAADPDPESPSPDSDRDVFAAVFQGPQLILALAHTRARARCFLSHPTTAPPALLAPACALLARSPALALTRAHAFGGPRAVLAALFAAPAFPAPAPTPTHTATACAATRATLPAAAPLLDARYAVRTAAPRDALPLLPLAHAFAAHAPGPPPTSHALLAVFRAAIAEGALYVVRASAAPEEEEEEEGQYEVAGYLLLGRNTPRTVAIRNVFVAGAHRRRGLAAAMVCAVTRACLGAPPPPPPPAERVRAPRWGTKDAVCLLVADPGAARLYARCGFVVDLEARDGETGRRVCFEQELWEVGTKT